MWRRLGLVVVAALAVFGCAQPQKPAAPLALGYHKHDCGPLYLGLKQTVECGTMVVAETRGANNGKTVELPVVIVRATATDKKPDPVIFLHGGPGGGIVDGVPFRLRKPGGMGIDDRDLIFFDQRGTGKSNPSFDCGDAPLSDAGVTSDDGVKVLSDCMAGWQAKGYDLTQYNSATIAKDIRDLRAALGITTYNLYGGSYGTRVAMAVMQHDPENLRAVVLNSTWPPEANATRPPARLCLARSPPGPRLLRQGRHLQRQVSGYREAFRRPHDRLAEDAGRQRRQDLHRRRNGRLPARRDLFRPRRAQPADHHRHRHEGRLFGARRLHQDPGRLYRRPVLHHPVQRGIPVRGRQRRQGRSERPRSPPPSPMTRAASSPCASRSTRARPTRSRTSSSLRTSRP
ncbi:MAG: alpha/beta hydrolase [Asticcacaulis sp.]